MFDRMSSAVAGGLPAPDKRTLYLRPSGPSSSPLEGIPVQQYTNRNDRQRH